MVRVEFRLEVHLTSLVAVVENFNPFLSGSALVEECEWDLSLSNVDTLVSTVGVEDLDVQLVGECWDIDLKVLSVPFGVLATINCNGGGPFLVTNAEVNEWVHLVQETTLVVFEVSVGEVEVDVTVSVFGEYNNDWHLKDINY